MILFDKFTLSNGLQFFIHKDTSTPMVSMNIIYDVGSRDEQPDKTGLAHFFEHLMFGGSKNVPLYDTPLQLAGGENNAWTNSDVTDFYLDIPKANIETAFWIESDRMLQLSLTKKSIETQRQVVIEEFKQTYLNQPYGDIWLLIKPLSYKTHPYSWNTIGKDISHIQNATTEDIRTFYKKFYIPNNAIVCIAGDVETVEMQRLAEKWFGNIPSGTQYVRNLPPEPKQTQARFLDVTRDVPQEIIFKTWHIGGRLDDDYYAADLLSDILGSGESSRLHTSLVEKKKIFTKVNAYITGDIDPGLLIFKGNVSPDIDIEKAEKVLNEEITSICEKATTSAALNRVKNKAETALAFENISIANKAMRLAICANLGHPELINTIPQHYKSIKLSDIQTVAEKTLIDKNCNTLFYRSQK